jgi:hypothetical protein
MPLCHSDGYMTFGVSLYFSSFLTPCPYILHILVTSQFFSSLTIRNAALALSEQEPLYGQYLQAAGGIQGYVLQLSEEIERKFYMSPQLFDNIATKLRGTFSLCPSSGAGYRYEKSLHTQLIHKSAGYSDSPFSRGARRSAHCH